MSEEWEQKLRELKVSTGKGELTLDELAMIQPGLARLMPEIGTRTWKLYYAAEAGNWDLAQWQWKETRNLFDLGATTRPKYETPFAEYLQNDWTPLGETIKAKDFAAFKIAFDKAIESANAWHEEKDHGYIRWKLPASPPPDLDLSPRKKS